MSDKTILENNSQETILDDSQTVIEDTNLTVIDSDVSLLEKQSFQLETFLDYKVIRQLETEGAEADIYVVTKDDKEYILKLYRYGIEPKKEVVKTLLDLSEKFPEDIVKIYKIDFHDDTNRWYEIQEYAKFGSLKDLDTSSLTSSVIKQVVAEINSILFSLHNNGIIHRDLKPANILIRNHSPLDLIMTDFGISSVLDDEMSKKMTSKSGTRIYFAPESFSGVIGKEVDLWAFGIILLELITGENIFDGINEGLIAYEIHTKGVAVPESIDPNLANLLKGLLTRDPKKRWSVKEVEQWLKGKTDIPIYYDYSSETTQGYEKPYVFNETKYYNLQDLVTEFTKSEKNWESGLAHYYRGYISKWLENNEDYDTSIATDKFKEETEERDLALAQLIYKYNPTLDFIVYGKLINLNNLLLFIGKYLNNTSSDIENQIVKDITTGFLQKFYEYYSQDGQDQENLTETFSNISKIPKNLSKENGKQLYIHNIYKYLELLVNKDKYYFPYRLEKVNPKNLIKNINQLNKLYTKVEFEALETKYLLPLSFKVSLKNADTIGPYLKAKEKFHEKALIKKQKFNKINEDINILQFFSVSNCCDNDKTYYEIFEFVEYGYQHLKNFLQKKEEYVLPRSFDAIEANNLIALYKNLDAIAILTKKDFNKYKRNYRLPNRLQNIDNASDLEEFIQLLKEYDECKKYFIKKDDRLLIKLDELHINITDLFSFEHNYLEDLNTYEKVNNILEEYSSILTPLLNLDLYVLPNDFNHICKNEPIELFALCKVLMLQSIANQSVFPNDHKLSKLTSKEYINLVSKKHYVNKVVLEKLLSNKALSDSFELSLIEKKDFNVQLIEKIKLIINNNIVKYPEIYLKAKELSTKINLSLDYKFCKEISKIVNLNTPLTNETEELLNIISENKSFSFKKNKFLLFVILPSFGFLFYRTLMSLYNYFYLNISINYVFFIIAYFWFFWVFREDLILLFSKRKRYINIDYAIGEMYYQKEKYFTSLPYLLLPAESGNIDAQFMLGYIYSDHKDYTNSRKWYDRCLSDVKTAANNLGIQYLNGQGVKLDVSKALELFEKADAELTSSNAYKIAMKLYEGDDIEKDIAKAVKFLKYVIENEDHQSAYFYLGYIYTQGLGDIKKNVSKAKKYYTKAVELGSSAAANNLGNIFKNSKNYKKAIEMYKIGIQRGNDYSYANLAQSYAEGWGVPKNLNEAKKIMSHAPETSWGNEVKIKYNL